MLDGRRPFRSGPALAGAAVMLTILLLGAVALSTHASYSLGPAPQPTQGSGSLAVAVIGEIALILALAVFELSIAYMVISLPWGRRRWGKDGVVYKKPPWRTRLTMAAIAVGLLAAQVAVLVLLLHRRKHPPSHTVQAAPGAPAHLSAANHPPLVDPSLVVPLATALALGIGLVLVALALRRYRRSGWRPTPLEEPLLDEAGPLASAIEAGLSEISAPRDAREAVVQAYAAMERVLADRGLGRRRNETPLEYLRRLVGGAVPAGQALTRLTDLYDLARFSNRTVDEEMRLSAEGALRQLRSLVPG